MPLEASQPGRCLRYIPGRARKRAAGGFFKAKEAHMRRRYKRRRNGRFPVLIVLALLAAAVLYYVFTIRLLPILKTIAVNNARITATQTINNAAGKVLKDNAVDYDKLMTLEKDGDGNITAIKADALQIDLLKYEITNEAVKEINDIDPGKLAVPIGTVIGGQLFSGTGPKINVRIEPVGNVETQLVNEFSSTGINQTRQRIVLNVTASLTIIVSSYSVTSDVESNFTIADTVIVGSVPDSYTVVEDGSGNASDGQSGTQSTAQRIFTYDKNQNKTQSSS
jgi:sporulation protein YunB